jgi:hypothetical protein
MRSGGRSRSPRPRRRNASELSFDYDGQLGSTTQAGQLGRLARVRGWERSALFDALGRLYEQHLTLTGWRDLTSDKTYRADGSVASDTLTIADPAGTVTFSSTKETVLDGVGPSAALKVDGTELYTVSYYHWMVARSGGGVVQLHGAIWSRRARTRAPSRAPHRVRRPRRRSFATPGSWAVRRSGGNANHRIW